MTKIMTKFVAATALVAAAVAPAAQRKVGQKPEPGAEATVSIGSPLLERYDMIVEPGARLGPDVGTDLGVQGHIRIISGSQLAIISNGKQLKACTVAQDAFRNIFGGQQSAACLTDRDKDGRFDSASSAALMFTTKTLKEPAPYVLEDVPENVGNNNHRVTLTYLGAAAGALRLSYREFANDMARPAFTEELTFPLTANYPQTITWRDTRITLLGQDGAGLRYRIEAAR